MALLLGENAGSAALQERTHDERDYEEPHDDAAQEGADQPDSGSLDRVLPNGHWAGTLIPSVGIMLMQVVWVAFLAYVAYSAWIHLPF
jgi:hypothetical protein